VNSDSPGALICAALRGEEAAWPEKSAPDFATALLERARYHGVAALLHERPLGMRGWPATVREILRRDAFAAGMWEMRDQAVLRSVLDALAKIGVRPIIFKGAALAYSLYPNPVLRSRGDADLLILARDRVKAADALESLGFVRGHAIPGDFVGYQGSYRLNATDGSVHSIDLHWKISNLESLSRLFSYEELLNRSTKLSRLHSDAIGAGAVDALLLACMHRAGHKRTPYYVEGVPHYGGDRLIWLYDIDLLARSFTSAQWQSLVRVATEKGLCATTRDGLQRAEQCFLGRCPEEVRNALSKIGEPVAAYFAAGAVRQAWMDFLAIGGTADRLRYGRELLFPPAAYMRSKYSRANPGWLPWLYARRAIGGLWNRLRHDRRAQ
jgi:hypothetical protein